MQFASLKNEPERLVEAAEMLECENQKLIKLNVSLSKRIAELEGKDAASLQLHIAELEQQLAVRNRLIFGDSSEKRPADKGKNNTEEKRKPPQTGHGPKEQPQLQILETVCELEESDRVCSCGKPLAEWNDNFEESEMIDVITRKFVIKRIKRKKYRCGCCSHVETALHDEPRLIPGGRYSNDFAIEVAIDKYTDHLPLERQARRMKREGLEVSSQTLWDQIDVLAKVLEPAYDKLKAYILGQPIIGADETHWKLLGNRGKKTKKWWVWAMCSEAAGKKAAYYELADNRGAEAAAALLDEYKGIVMVDGYKSYQSCKEASLSLRLVHCWAHVRRKFIECQPQYPKECKTVLDWIGELYAIDKQVRGSPAHQRLSVRQEQSKPIIDNILKWSTEVRALPGSSIRKAIEYMRNLWDGLTLFLKDGLVPLDNNHTERGIRGIVVGRKNHYGSKSKRGTKVASVFYSLIETAKLVGVEPRGYLRAALREALEKRDVPLPHQIITNS